MRGLSALIALTLMASLSHAGVTFKTCDRSQEERLTVAMGSVPAMIKGIRSEIKKRYGNLANLEAKNLPREKGLVKNADTMLACADRVAKSNLIFECNETLPGGAVAWTLPVIGKTIKYSYELFYSYESRKITSVILHELTHKCGANDADYFFYGPPESTRFFDWSTIADTYRYWGDYGFCTPGKDCF